MILFKAEIKDTFSFKWVNETKKMQSYAWTSSTKKKVVFSVAFLPSPKVKINLISRSMRAGPHRHYGMSSIQGICNASREWPNALVPHASIPTFVYFIFFQSSSSQIIEVHLNQISNLDICKIRKISKISKGQVPYALQLTPACRCRLCVCACKNRAFLSINRFLNKTADGIIHHYKVQWL